MISGSREERAIRYRSLIEYFDNKISLLHENEGKILNYYKKKYDNDFVLKLEGWCKLLIIELSKFPFVPDKYHIEVTMSDYVRFTIFKTCTDINRHMYLTFTLYFYAPEVTGNILLEIEGNKNAGTYNIRKYLPIGELYEFVDNLDAYFLLYQW